jgi:hypothetical protein
MNEMGNAPLSVPELRALQQTIKGLQAFVQELPSGPEREQQSQVLQEVLGRITGCLADQDTEPLSITTPEMSVLLDVMLEAVRLVRHSRRRGAKRDH